MDKYYIHENDNGSYREATEEEIRIATEIGAIAKKLSTEIYEAEMKLKDLRLQCTHEVCYDDPGFPFDTRICVACGYTSLI